VTSNLPQQIASFEKRLTDRKARLFLCACARLVWHLLEDPHSRQAIEVSEAFAEDRASITQLASARTNALQVVTGLGREAGCHATRDLLINRTQYPSQDPYYWYANTAGVHWLQSICDRIARLLGAEAAHRTPADQGWASARDRAYENGLNQVEMLLLDAVGVPAPEQRTWPDHLIGLASACAEGQPDFPFLADALDDLGEPSLAEHCRLPLHTRCCWVVDWILGKSVADLPATRALNVSQPWAELILRGLRTLEVRKRATTIRERVQIYAGDAEIPSYQRQYVREQYGIETNLLPRQHLLGSVEIVGCRPLLLQDYPAACQPISRTGGLHAWLLANPRRALEWHVPTHTPRSDFFKPF
jgi:hypothetical protein